jgi:hypothetical protein
MRSTETVKELAQVKSVLDKSCVMNEFKVREGKAQILDLALDGGEESAWRSGG